MTKYAEGTTVPVERSEAEVRKLLQKHGATHFMMGEGPQGSAVQFRYADRMYRFDVPKPTATAMRDAFFDENNDDWRAQTRARAIDWPRRATQEHMRLWRARVVWLKALFEFADVVPLEQSMMANLVLPDGRTFGKWAEPQVEAMYDAGQMPPMLGDGR